MPALRDERGAVAVIVALFLTVLLGMAALVVDVGRLRLEKVELQNGTDAAAVALAKACAADPSGAVCTSPTSTAKAYLDGNAEDRTANAQVTMANGTVTVVGTTRNVDGTTGIRNVFARVLGHDRTSVKATSVATWQAPPPLVAPYWLPIRQCAVNNLTANGSSFGQTVTYVFSGVGGSCPSVPDGTQVTGGQTDTKCNPNSDCDNYLDRYLPLEVLLPVVDTSNRQVGFVSFVATSYRINGGHRSASTPCKVDACVAGYFTQRAWPGRTQPSQCDPFGFVLYCTFPTSASLVR